ncbi:MAG: DUF1249 domain-containing protein [Endozoicomonas sp. (ex Botrylloides leachii)]|nr:DUF1249 domain-containing protein [Endozoicomonas sp. (ex Botrylloides leachii)]
MTKKIKKTDLSYHHSLCEINYARLLQLMPNDEVKDYFQFSVTYSHNKANHCHILSFSMLQQSRYTTGIRIKLDGFWDQWVEQPELDVRLYHDVKMAEVTMAQKVKRLPIGVEPCHLGVCQPNEKLLLNQFLAELLDFCIQGGHVSHTVFCPNERHENIFSRY